MGVTLTELTSPSIYPGGHPESNRKTTQTTCTPVSASAAASVITTHLTVGGTNTLEDSRRLKERLDIAAEAIGRSFAVPERKTINPGDLKFLCIDDVQQLLGFGCENQFADFCERLPKDAEVGFLSTFLSAKTRYGTLHGLSNFSPINPSTSS